jgi:hypothetical protein
MGLRLGTFVDPENTGDYPVELARERKAAFAATVCLAIGRPVQRDLRLEGARDSSDGTGKLDAPSGKVDIADGEAVPSGKLPHGLHILLGSTVGGAVLLSRQTTGRGLGPAQVHGRRGPGLRVYISNAIVSGGVTVAPRERLSREFRHRPHLRSSWRSRLAALPQIHFPDGQIGRAA